MLARKRKSVTVPIPALTTIFRPQRPASVPVHITGVLGTLPPELVSAIIDILLVCPARRNYCHYDGTRAEAYRSAEDVQNFVRSCRGVLSVLTEAQRIECRARAVLFVLPRPYRMLQPSMYTDLAHMFARTALMEVVFADTTKMQLFHCARTTHECCRALRAEWNRHLLTFQQHPLHSRVRTVAMEGYSKVEMTVVAATTGSLAPTLRSATTDGGVLVQQVVGETCVLKRFSPAKAVEFSPDTEHQEVARIMETHNISCVTDHPDGSLITLVDRGTCAFIGAHPNYEKRNPAITKWSVDGKTAELELELGELPFPDLEGVQSRLGVALSMWLRGTDELWIAFVNNVPPVEMHGDFYETEQLLLVTIDLKKGVVVSHRHLPVSLEIVHLGVARGTGHCAFLDVRLSNMYTTLHYYNTDTRRLTFNIDKFPSETEDAIRTDAVSLTPDGRSMVVIGRTKHQRLMMRTYKCFGLRSGQDSAWHIWPERADHGQFVNATLSMGVLEEVILFEVCMSPCGSKVLLLYKTMENFPGDRCAIIVLDIEMAFACRVRLCTSTEISKAVCPRRISWAHDGIYVEAKEGGVLRLGLVQ